MSQRKDTGLNTNPWPVLLDHYREYKEGAMSKIITNDISDNLVSIIVPTYNVELFIEKCLKSVMEQSFSNIEVIVVNDGSTDNTGEVVDNYIQPDNRVRVLHTENAGVSAARNSGILASTGDYLIFVDGDDYIAEDYVSYMLGLIKNTQSDFCLSRSCYTKKGEKQNECETIENFNSKDAITLLLSPDVVVGCWNKIYKRSLIVSNNIWFSTSLFYGEGLTFITDVAQVANSVGVGNRKVYYYRKNNETSATTAFDIKKIYNGEKALINIKNKLKIKSNKVDTMFDYHLCKYRLGALVKIKSNHVEKEYLEDYSRWLTYIRKNYFKFVFFDGLTVYRKLLLLGGCLSPFFMMKLDEIRQRRIFKNSVDD
jgi:glycosyltransferase involved in cell wall biosynthesis